MQDICQFRTEVDLSPETLEEPMYLDLELQYANASERGPPEVIYDSPSEVRLPLLTTERRAAQPSAAQQTDREIGTPAARFILFCANNLPRTAFSGCQCGRSYRDAGMQVPSTAAA